MTQRQSAGPPSLRASVIWTFTGNVTASAAQFVLVALLAHLGGPKYVGLYSLGLSITAPIFLLLGLQLRSVQATDVRAEYPFGSYLTVRVIGMLLAFATVLALLPAYPAARGVLLAFGVAKALEGISDVIYGRLQRAERLDRVARSLMLHGILGLVLPGLAFVITRSVEWAVAALVVVDLVLLLAYDVPRVSALRPRWHNRSGLKSLLRVSWPLGVVVALISLSGTLPRLVIERDLGAGALGIYSALSYVNTAGTLVVGAVGTALTTRLSMAYAMQDRRAFLSFTGRFVLAAVLVGLGVVAVAAVAGRPLLGLLFGPDFARESGVFVWLAVAGVFGYAASCAGYAVTAARRFLDQLPLFAVVALALYLGCLWLVPHWGLIGAAVAGLFGSLVQLVGSYFIVWRSLRAMGTAAAVPLLAEGKP